MLKYRGRKYVVETRATILPRNTRGITEVTNIGRVLLLERTSGDPLDIKYLHRGGGGVSPNVSISSAHIVPASLFHSPV